MPGIYSINSGFVFNLQISIENLQSRLNLLKIFFHPGEGAEPLAFSFSGIAFYEVT
jgi:hypothetical protein